ncbi:MAG: FAD binding domain-containing protein [Planctomycetales bacterium]|nr:FAD binding domain-containing protein [Planctomycetales bacterium]
MKNFEYAQPRTEQEAVALLADQSKHSVVLAGGTDLISLMKRSVITPDRVVNIAEISGLQRIQRDEHGSIWVGAAVSLQSFLESSYTTELAAAQQIIQGIASLQLQAQGTVVGELLRRPMCWYFRSGHGLLAQQGRMVVEGDNRYHAILGNRRSAKFVNPSRLAPALIAAGAFVRIIKPGNDERFLELESLYQTPDQDGQTENVLTQGELVTHVMIPAQRDRLSAAYEIRHGEGPDQPLVSAAVGIQAERGIVREATVVLGQVAPIPWMAVEAARNLVGQPLNEQTATTAGIEAVAGALPLSGNEYKIQLTQVAVKRAVLRAAGLECGGLECQPPLEQDHHSGPLMV